MSLTVIIGTRGRPDQLKTTLERTLPNIVRSDTKLLVLVDADDEATLKAKCSFPSECVYSVKPREDTRGLKYERARTEAPADLYLVGHDCAPIVTSGFDQMVVEAGERFPDGIGCVCSPLVNASFPAFQAPTAKLVDLMGYIYPTMFPYWYIDHWLDDIARMIDRYTLVDVHQDCSPHPGKTIGMRDVAFWATYYDLLAGERHAQAERILEAMNEPEWRRQMFRHLFWPRIDERSRWVNDIVRANAEMLEKHRAGPEVPTEQYQRAYVRALDHLAQLHARKDAE